MLFTSTLETEQERKGGGGLRLAGGDHGPETLPGQTPKGPSQQPALQIMQHAV